jgi:hypothetical protein
VLYRRAASVCELELVRQDLVGCDRLQAAASAKHDAPGRSLAKGGRSVVRPAVRALFYAACADHHPIDSIIVCASLWAS